MRSLAYLGIIFLLALGFASAGLHWVIPRVKDPAVFEKIDYLRKNGDAFDVLFIGTSRIHHQIAPSLFDARMAEAGIATHSFNLGIDGLRTPEDTYVLESALRGRTRPLRWIIMECKDINFREEEVDQRTTRAVYWHDAPRMGILAQRLMWGSFSGHRNFQHTVKEYWDGMHVFLLHSALWLQNETCAGVVAQANRDLCSPQPTADSFSLAGFDPPRNERMTTKQNAEYRASLQDLQAHPAEFDYKDRTSQQLLRREAELAALHGAKLILLIPPTLNRFKFVPDPTFSPAPTVLDFDRPDTYPELFSVENRLDESHLNAHGANLLTSRLADGILSELRASQQILPAN